MEVQLREHLNCKFKNCDRYTRREFSTWVSHYTATILITILSRFGIFDKSDAPVRAADLQIRVTANKELISHLSPAELRETRYLI